MFPVADVIPSRTTPWMTVALIAVNLIGLLSLSFLSNADEHIWSARLAFVVTEPSWTTATTSLFVHQNTFHLLLNALVLWVFGDNVEDQIGHARFLVLYLLSGYVGYLVVWWATPSPYMQLVGPGGAIAGVLGAYFMMFPRSRVLVLVPARSLIDAVEVPAVLPAAIWLSLQVFGLGRLDRSFDGNIGPLLWPIVGGAVTGCLAVRVIRRPERRRVEWWGR